MALAERGHSVTVVESAARLGGKVLSYCCKATDTCSRCGVCVAHTEIAEALAQPRIEFAAAATIRNVQERGRRIDVQIERNCPTLLHAKCQACDACVAACPTGCISKYERGGLVFYAVDHSRCLRQKGKRCNKCITACPHGALTAAGTRQTIRVRADAVLVACGHTPYDAAGKPQLAYGRLEGVFTGTDAEEILSRRAYLRKPGESVAFVQCVGSRDPEIGRNYCSAVCCAYAARIAKVLKYRQPKSDVTVYYIDLQCFDKAFTAFRHELDAQGVQLVRSIPFAIDGTADGRLRLKIEGEPTPKGVAEHDAVVLSVGLGPAQSAPVLAEQFGLSTDKFGFLSSNRDNVFVCGTCAAPQSIPESMASARATAADMLKQLGRTRRKPAPRRGSTRPLNKHVLVVGAGIAGAQTAHELRTYGYRVTMLEQTAACGGQAARWASGTDIDTLLRGATIRTRSRLRRLDGNVGAFSAQIEKSGKTEELACGAVVLCAGPDTQAVEAARLCDGERLSSVDELDARLQAAGLDTSTPKSVALVLDMNVHETKASTELALRSALNYRREHECEVFLFCRELRVAALHMEELYDQAREAGVVVVKYDGALRIEPASGTISANDVLLGETVTIQCDAIAASDAGLCSGTDPELLRRTGVGADEQGQAQQNNVHLFPHATNRPGIFTVGACRGVQYLPQIVDDAKAAALAVHGLLCDARIPIEPGTAEVDAAKCALCLTCLRSCPHGAIVVDETKRAAMPVPGVCRRCGVCVGECPAGAITLPEVP